MKKVFLMLLLAACAARAQAPALTTVEDVIYKPDGSTPDGTLKITPQNFITSGNAAVVGATVTKAITDGVVAVMLAPNTGTVPSGTSYKVEFYESLTQTAATSYWVVPTSSPVATPAAPASVTQAGTPGATTRCYFVSAINATGETLLGPGLCTTTSHATLDGTNYNIVTTPAVTGSTACRVWRANTSTAPTAGETGLHLVSGGNVTCGNAKNDQSNTLTSATVPIVNDTDPVLIADVQVAGAVSPNVSVTPAQVSGTAIVSTPTAAQSISQALTLTGALTNSLDNATNNNVTETTVLQHTTSGTPAAGIGARLTFKTESGDENPSTAGHLDYVLNDVGAGTEDSEAQVWLRAAGAAAAKAWTVNPTSLIASASGHDLCSSGARCDVFGLALSSSTYGSTTNCSDSAGDAACSAAPAGSFVIDAADTNTVVSTTIVTADSQIIVVEDSSLGTRLGVTCNTTLGRTYAITARTAATSFTVTADAAPVTNPACMSYWVIN